MNSTILMIDDDLALLRLTELTLTKAGYRFVSAPHGIAGLQVMERERPDLIVLDVMMPKLNGWETCRLIREVATTPVIILTAHDDEADIARGLDLGADDYVTKPFSFVELQARIRALLRRADLPVVNAQSQAGESYQVGSLFVDVGAHVATLHDAPIPLTPTEFRLLVHMLRHAGQTLSHGQLLSAVWGSAYNEATELLKPTISRLRQKVEDDPAHPTRIVTVYGVGYRFLLRPATNTTPSD